MSSRQVITSNLARLNEKKVNMYRKLVDAKHIVRKSV